MLFIQVIHQIETALLKQNQIPYRGKVMNTQFNSIKL